MRRMVRPIKHKYEKRSEQVKIRLTIAEKEDLQNQADRAGYSVAEYVRRRAVGHVIAPASRPQFNPALVSEINRIGVNVKQLKQAVHMKNDFVKYWTEISDRVRNLILELVDGTIEPLVTPELVRDVKAVGVVVNKLALSVNTYRKFVKHWQKIGHEVEVMLGTLEISNDS